jgi:hypothetical protein
MKNLVLGSLIALTASQAAGCVIESDGGGDDAFITANWTFRDEATGTTTGCPAGFDTVALYNQEVTSSGSPLGSPIIDLFDCVDGSGTSAPLPPTLFQSWIAVTNTNNTSQYGESPKAYVDVTVSDKTFSAQILNDGGYFFFRWNLYGESTDADLSCAQAGATGGVESIATDVSDSSNSASDQFDCEDRAAYTAGFRAGTYTFSVAALDSNDQSIGTAPELLNEPIGTHNAINDLGLIEIPISGL